MTGHGDRVQPRRRRRADPALKSAEALEAIANPSSRPSSAQFNLEINVLPRAALRFAGVSGFEDDLRSQPQPRRAQGQRGPRPHGDDRHPADARGRPPEPLERSAPTRATSCSATRSWRPGARTSSSTSGPRAAADDLGVDHAGGGVHEHPAAHPGQPGQLRGVLERLAGDQPASSSRVGANSPYLLGKELWRETRIPLFEQATDTRSEELKDQGVRPRVWFGERWINSIFDLFEENVRYFPALLPITDDEDPLAGARGRRHPARCPSCSCTTARSTAGTGRSTTSSTACPTCGWRTACSRPGRPWSTRWPTPRSTSAWCARSPRTTGRCGRRCRSPRPRRTSTSPPQHGHRRAQSTGRASARCRPPSWCCGGCCRWRARGSTAGASRPTRPTGCSASSSSAA